jgi:ribosomal protein S18 acetylase RimI-like enzyme
MSNIAQERVLHDSENFYIKEANPREKAELYRIFSNAMLGSCVDSPHDLILVAIDKETKKVIGGIKRSIDVKLHRADGEGFIVLPEFQGKGIGTALAEVTDKELKERGVRHVRLAVGSEEAWKIFRKIGYRYTPFVESLLKSEGKDTNEFFPHTIEKEL